jgi:hypothetical protein
MAVKMGERDVPEDDVENRERSKHNARIPDKGKGMEGEGRR